MADLALWATLAGSVIPLGLHAWVTARRLARARHGERWFLRHRRRVLRVYHRLRDGRVYDPARNPELRHWR